MFRLEEYTGLLKNKVINGFIVLTKKSKKKKKRKRLNRYRSQEQSFGCEINFDYLLT